MPEDARIAELIEEGRHAERMGALDRALSCFETAAGAISPALAAEALTRQADVHRSRAEWDAGLAAARRAQLVAAGAGMKSQQAEAVVAEANVLMCRGDFPAAMKLFEQLLGEGENAKLRGIALQNIGSMLAQQGHLGAAERAFAESYGCFQRAGYRRGEAISLNNYGRVSLDRQNVGMAEQLLDQALTIAREVEDADLIALAMLNLAEAVAQRGDSARAADLASTALGYFAGCGNRWRQIECLRLIGSLNERRGDHEDAGRCYERGLALAREIGAQVEITSLRDCLARVRAPRR
ncbi:MAG TPA: tetratricopeptide repeat protein [Gemmatimonadaceae bacterium]|nr:tetratricopeptide repeat protein [Gemmatimonadaceae bacterium]